MEPKIPCVYLILKYISGQVPETAGKEKGTPCLTAGVPSLK